MIELEDAWLVKGLDGLLYKIEYAPGFTAGTSGWEVTEVRLEWWHHVNIGDEED